MHEHDLPDRRNMDEGHCGRRDHCPLLDDEAVDRIAERAASLAIEKMTSHVYQQIGRGLVTKFMWLLGVAADGGITGQAVSDPDFAQYKLAVGRVNRILDDGRAEVAVIVH